MGRSPATTATTIIGAILNMAYKPVQNESAHLTDKPNRPAYEAKHQRKKKRATESPAMKKPTSYEKPKAGKTRS